MCGIIGYIGKDDNAVDLVVDGLKQLEYRGYDSAGVVSFYKKPQPAEVEPRQVGVFYKKAIGSVDNLAEKTKNAKKSNCAIAHTRWATHGAPSIQNAHPHHDCKKNVFLVHNGIIENHTYLREVLIREGHTFNSDTDTEVLAHLIERHLEKHTLLEDAVLASLNHIKGTFAIAVIAKNRPDKIVIARRSSPLIIGLGSNGYFVASDISAVTPHTKKVIYLDDDELVVLKRDKFSFYDFKKKIRRKSVDTVDWDVAQAKKEGYPHFMLKEIHKQPESIRDSIRGRLIFNKGKAKLGGLEVLSGKTKDINRIVISACGTAYYAGLAGKYMFEKVAGISTEVDLASEYRYRSPIINKNTAFLVISQSGETADTISALELAKEKRALALGIVNTVGSTISRLTSAGVYNHIGPEIGVASTKAYTSQLTVLALFALFLGRERGLTKKKAQEIIKHIFFLPAQIEKILKTQSQIKNIAQKYSGYNNFLYLGRNYNYPTALEGALKLKEISYIHAEGYSAGEMKHGPIALIDKNFPTVAIVGGHEAQVYEKIISNLEEIKARGGPIIAVAEEEDNNIQYVAGDIIYIPKTVEMLNPILSVIPLQLFAYHMAVMRNLNPDKPRNLAKSVTVE